MSSTSDDEMDSFTPQEHPWQVVKGVKMRKNTTNKEAVILSLTLDNRYSTLTPPLENETSEQDAIASIPTKPPPIFVYGVTNLPQMKQKFTDVIEEEQYITKGYISPTNSFNKQQGIIH
ncbi:hypothetical protein FQA39_LY13842 [Lamprigera yunnana]|nr:hypothetical protein FQA39_LY13842 [Lamprigera yunnana]